MDIDIKLMVELNETSYAILENITKNLAELGLTLSEFLILKHLDQNKKESVQKIGSVALITSGTITFVLKKMETRGYVSKVQDQKDKRIFWVKITNSGRKRFRQIFKTHLIYLDGFLLCFTKQEKREFIERLAWFKNKLKDSGGHK